MRRLGAAHWKFTGMRSDPALAEPNTNTNCSPDIMPRKKKPIVLSQPVRNGLSSIKVRLDARTVITLASLKALDFWKQRYPKAEVIG